MSNNKQILLAGAAPDTGNLGVSALFYSTVAGVSERLTDHQLIVFDHGAGIRDLQIAGKEDKTLAIKLCGAKHSRRYYQNENFTNIHISCKLGGGINPIAQCILHSTAMLDSSGGDSFTDLYGSWRFKAITYPKLIAIENKIPLILLPQTYGPYLSTDSRNQAAKIVKDTTMAWARDAESFEELKSLLGSAFDENKHYLGVDVAFLLPSKASPIALSNTVQNWLTERKVATVGINISGLIYNQPDKAHSQYGLKANYQQVVYHFIKKLLTETDCNIVLIPHVLVAEKHFESDMAACKHVLNLFQDADKQRIEIISDSYDQCEIKWVISQMDWFCGTRMHSTIASLSTGVATAAIAYSLKTWRVFKTCGQEQQVIDPREIDTQAVVDGLWQCWLQRHQVKLSLQQQLPKVLSIAKQQMDLICATIANVQK
jgi:polysaccharide pyruvyl transferase WcaK-like protein